MTLVKRLGIATARITLSNGLVRLLSLISMPILTHLLSTSAYGEAAMAGTVISLVSVIALAGMDMSYMRAYFSSNFDEREAVEYFSWRFTVFAGIIASACVVVSWPWFAARVALPRYLGWLVAAGTLFAMLGTMAQTRARLNDRYGGMSIAIVVSGVVSTVASITIAFLWRRDATALVLPAIVGYATPLLILGTPKLSRLWKGSGLNKSARNSTILIGLAGIVTAPAYWVISSSDRWFIGYFDSVASAGIYSVASSVAIMGTMVNTAVLAVWTPEVTRAYDADPEHAHVHLGQIAEWVVAGFACVWMAVTAAGGDIIRLLAAPAFHPAAGLVPYIAAGVFFNGLIHLANASLLVKKRLTWGMWWWIAGSVSCIGLNFLLVPAWGILGAAVTQAISFAVIAGGIAIGARRAFPLVLNARRLVVLLLGVLIAGIAMSMPWWTTPIKSLLMKLPAALVVAFIVMRLGVRGARA
jgi:O-antigen/teichoic acid export membrane protein